MGKIVIVNYGVGNIQSISNAFKAIGYSCVVTNETKEIMSADRIVLPGVGAFGHAFDCLKKLNLVQVLQDYATSNRPVLGICLGMQLLFDTSEEFGIHQGLGIIPGKVVKFKSQKKIKLPHVGWNSLEVFEKKWKKTVLHDLKPEHSYVYFTHSFVAVPTDSNNILALTSYDDVKFCSAVEYKNVMGCQFHPEKSGVVGLKIIKNFCVSSFQES